ncbi:MAG: hypothetical protein SWJ54_22675, partial [Cyanobacteriota bacterium]|nr:hypothetical protein [Cyanobacteriota bacterium]
MEFNSHHSQDEQKLYAHLQQCAETESPQQLIQRFRSLFLGEVEYRDPEIWAALNRIVDADFAQEEFPHILNRCCYILINRWLKRRKLQWAIYELVELFEVLPTGLPPCWTAQRLRSLIQYFLHSEQYQALHEGTHNCPSCEKSGRCTLQAVGYEVDMVVSPFPYQF